MEESARYGVVLFESGEDEEDLRIECALTRGGGLVMMQESAGPLTEWCFEESPHRIETEVAPEGVRALMAYLHFDDPAQLPLGLRAEFTGFDCCRRIRGMLRSQGIGYEVAEHVIRR